MSEMDHIVEKMVGDVRLQIDRSLCVGFEHCAEEAPEAWHLGDDEIVQFLDPTMVERARLLRSVAVCPVSALSAFDAEGNQLAP